MQGPYGDDTIATTIERFTGDEKRDEPTIDCPVDNCGFSAEVTAVVAHVNGTNDMNHRWSRLEYEDASEFREQHLD